MELYFGLCVFLGYANIYVLSQNTTSTSSICKSYMLNGHYVKWPNPKVEADYLAKKSFIPKNIIFTRFQTCGNQVFLVSPRYKEGVPFSLSYLKLNGKDQCYNYVRQFPTLEKSYEDNRKSILNAIDIYMGQNGILWVLDLGVINTLEEKLKPEYGPKILGIESGSGLIMHTILLKSLICRKRSRLQYLVVEYISNEKPIIYIGDGGTRSIIVWDVKAKKGYRTKLPSLSSKDLTRNDVFYLALIENSNMNYIYYTYLSCSDMFKVRTRDLGKKINPKSVVDVGRKPYKMILLGSAYGTVIYFRIKGLNHLYSWDTKESLLEENLLLVKKSVVSHTITHIDVDNNGVLWELESNIENFVVNTVGCYGPSVILAPIFGQPVRLRSG